MIYYDFRHYSKPNTGLARYSWSVLSTIIDIAPDSTKFKVLIEKGFAENIIALFSSNKNIQFIELDYGPFNWKNIFLHRKLALKPEDLFVYPHFNPPLFLKNAVFVIHDLLPLIIKDYFGSNKTAKRFYFKVYLSYVIRKYHCITVSRATLNDISCLLPKAYLKAKNMKVIHEDIPLPYPNSNSYKKSTIGNKNDFIFYIGDWRAHKNLLGMIDLYSKMVDKGLDKEFLIAGSSNDFSSLGIMKKIIETPGVKYIGHLSDRELDDHLNNCSALFFLTHYEGFGLPILEAGFRGKKIITNNLGGAPEIAPSWAFKLNSRVCEEHTLDMLIEYINSRQTLSQSQINEYKAMFSWMNTADYILKLNK